MSRKEAFKLLEKQLKKKFINMNENEVILREEDFKDGKLIKSGYISLKQQSDYIAVHENIEIKIPKDYINGFKEALEYVATKELLRIKSDIKEANLIALMLFLAGILLLALPFIEFFRIRIINDIIVIVSWVFVWASVEKKFFEITRLKNRKQNLLHILSSQIKTY